MKKSSAGSVFDRAVGEYGAILDVTMKPRDREKVIRALSSQWRDWAETKTGNALKLQTRGGGRTIDAIARKFQVKIEVLILQPDDTARAKELMAQFWRYSHSERGRYSGPVFTLKTDATP